MRAQQREEKKAKKFTKYVPGAKDGKEALEVLDNMAGGKSSTLLVGSTQGVTERDKVSEFSNYHYYERSFKYSSWILINQVYYM